MIIPCAKVLNVFVLTGCMMTFMLRINIAIAILAMPDMTAYFNALDANQTADNSTNTTAVTPNESDFLFDPWKQNMILGSFFWGYIITEIPGGRLSEMFGAKLVFGLSILTAATTNLITPLVAYWFGYQGLVSLRVLQGLALGAVFPSIYPLAAKWIPPMERSKFMSHMLALSLGAAVTYPLCGFLIASLGWQSVFYSCSVLGIIWASGWFYFVYDSPSQHPMISAKERLKIEGLIGTSASRKVHSVPWLKLILSPPVWAVILTHTANVFCYTTISIQTPTFFKQILDFNIKTNGIYSSLPQLGKYFVGIVSGYVTFYILANKKMSPINTRRTFVFISTGLPCLFMMIQAHKGNHVGWSIFNLVATLTLNGAVTGGHLCTGLDIAPNFAGTIFGMANTLGSLASFLSSFIIGKLTFETQTWDQWQIVFWILSGVYLMALLSFMVLGSATLQEWNIPDIKIAQGEEEKKPLNVISPPIVKSPLTEYEKKPLLVSLTPKVKIVSVKPKEHDMGQAENNSLSKEGYLEGERSPPGGKGEQNLSDSLPDLNSTLQGHEEKSSKNENIDNDESCNSSTTGNNGFLQNTKRAETPQEEAYEQNLHSRSQSDLNHTQEHVQNSGHDRTQNDVIVHINPSSYYEDVKVSPVSFKTFKATTQ